MSTTTFLLTTAPVLSATFFSKEGSLIFAACLYASLIIIAIIVTWISTMGCDCRCNCNPCQNDSIYDDDNCCCVDCVEMIKRTCCVLMCRYACLRIYSCCCMCSPNFSRTLENSVRELEMRMEDGYENNEEMMMTQFNSLDAQQELNNFDFLGSTDDNSNFKEIDAPILIKTGKTD